MEKQNHTTQKQSKKFRQPPKPKEEIKKPATKEELQNEYTRLCTVKGDAQYHHDVKMANINAQLLELNKMHADLVAKEKA